MTERHKPAMTTAQRIYSSAKWLAPALERIERDPLIKAMNAHVMTDTPFSHHDLEMMRDSLKAVYRAGNNLKNLIKYLEIQNNEHEQIRSRLQTSPATTDTSTAASV